VLRPDKSQAIRPQAQLISQEAMEKLQGGRILLVEDNQINQLVARDLMESMGLQVFIADNGEQAVEMVKIGHYDVVLMDIQMPGMDGYQTTGHIRGYAHANLAQLPIIAMTANAMETDRQKALDAGMNDYLSKPIDVAQLANVLLRWVDRRITKSESTPASQNKEIVGLPATLDLIDMTGALKRLGDNKEFYRRLLLMFQIEHANDVQETRSALQRHDLELARRQAHNLKGVAGMVGANDLREAAKKLEMAIAEGNTSFYETYLADVEQKLAVVLVAIVGITNP
jgi:CheY-like chemotaxis protein/HPt (histidine-containing phosphotransfer) domain-containing protein